jgi:release factor glutamine methyltransferase
LQKELDWFLEDAVASPPWARLQREEHKASSSASSPVVSLRSSLPDLSVRWEARIKERLPFQYVVGIAHWRRVTLAVGSGVLCPRPETEQLVDLAAAAFREMAKAEKDSSSSSSPSLSSLPWADLGTGSGAIAVGLALDALVVSSGGGRGNGDGDGDDASTSSSPSASFPSTRPPRVFAVDASPLAASWARLNVSRLNLENRVTVLEGSWLEPVFEERGKEARTGNSAPSSLPSSSPFSSSLSKEAFLAGVVSNPPYIPRSQLATLQREVRDHEPSLALDGGAGAGLDSLRPLCASAARALACGGFLALETAGKEQASEVASDLLEGSGFFEDVHVHEDLFGVARFVTATRKRREE